MTWNITKFREIFLQLGRLFSSLLTCCTLQGLTIVTHVLKEGGKFIAKIFRGKDTSLLYCQVNYLFALVRVALTEAGSHIEFTWYWYYFLLCIKCPLCSILYKVNDKFRKFLTGILTGSRPILDFLLSQLWCCHRAMSYSLFTSVLLKLLCWDHSSLCWCRVFELLRCHSMPSCLFACCSWSYSSLLWHLQSQKAVVIPA